MPQPNRTARSSGLRKWVFRAGVVCLLALSATGVLLWREGRLQNWLKARALQAHLKHIQPLLPFEIENVEVRTRLKDLLEGELSSVILTIRRDGWRMHLAGPMEITTGKFLVPSKIEYRPEVTAEPVAKGRAGRTDPLNAVLTASFSENGTAIRHFGLSVSAPDESWRWPLYGVSLATPELVAFWDGTSGGVHFSARQAEVGSGGDIAGLEAPSLHVKVAEGKASLSFSSALASFTQNATDNAAQAESVRVMAEVPLSLAPFAAGPEARIRLSAKSAEAMWNERYHQAPFLAELPVDLTVTLPDSVRSPGKGGASSHASGLPAGLPSNVRLDSPLLKASIQLETARDGSIRVRAGWKTPPLALKDLSVKWLPAAGLESSLPVRELSGKLRTEGRLVLSLPRDTAPAKLAPGSAPANLAPSSPASALIKPSIEQLNGRLRLTGLGFVMPEKMARVDGLDLDLPFDWTSPREGFITAKTLQHRRIRWTVEKTPLLLSRESLKAPFGISLRSLPLPIELRPLHVRWGDPAEPGRKEAVQVRAGLQIRETLLTQTASGLCVNPWKTPPGTLEANIPELRLRYADGNASLEADGWIKLSLFNGVAVLVPRRAEGLLGERPFVSFDAQWGGIQLGPLGKWLNFGKMDGIVQGYAKNVEIAGGYPVNFDFRTELKPFSKSDIVFSPQAMKNFVGLIAKEQLEQIPGIMRWFYFGFPRAVTGGYDLWYAGISLTAKEGAMVLETHDEQHPDARKYCMRDDPRNKNFITCGQWFKMPIIHNRYPVVMDAIGLAHMVRDMVAYLGSLRQQDADGTESGSGGDLGTQNENKESSDAGNAQTGCFQ